MPLWNFSALGFRVLWRAAGNDVLPYPVQCRSIADSTADFDRQWRAEAGGLAARADEDLEAAVRILRNPEARIEMSGFAGAAVGPGDLLAMGDPRQRIRVLAVVFYQQAVLVTQQPTGDPESGGEVQLSLLRAEDLVRRLLVVLPGAVRGAGATVRVNRTDLEIEDEGPFTAFHDDAPRSVRARATGFFNRPRSAVVYVAVRPGAVADRRPTPARDFHVVDYPDGRYLVRHNATVLRADPADVTVLYTHLQGCLDNTLRDFREDNDPSYV